MSCSPSRVFSKTRDAHDTLGKLFYQDPVVERTCVVETRAGRVCGFQGPESTCTVFRGIPFARAARLQNPQPAVPWSGEKQCHRFGPACPQPAFGFVRLTNEGLCSFALEALSPPLLPLQSYSYGHLSEEHCLNLNVYTPNVAGNYPVMVFIHGGAFQSGSSVEAGLYDGSGLAEHEDVVVVTINYRIGPFGFCNFPEHGITNLGIRDQIAALGWVRDNVAGFGGDPGNVTIFGQSAGAMCISILLQSPLARGLFHGAILMSGGLLLCQTPKQNGQVMNIIEGVLQKECNVEGKLTPNKFCLIPEEKLIQVMDKVQFDMTVKKKLGSFDAMWVPFRGDDVLPMRSVEYLLEGCPPVMTGHMGDEWQFFRQMFSTLAPDIAGPTKKNDALDFVVSALRMHFGQSALDDAPGDAEKWKTHAAWLYGKVEAARILKHLSSDVQSVCGGCMQFVYFEYVSDYLAKETGGYSFTIWGPSGAHNANGHFREMPMVFNFGHPSVHKLYDQEMLGSPGNTADKAMSELLMGAVASFSKSRQPVIADVEWLPFPENMNLQINPGSTLSNAYADLHVSFTELREVIIADFGIGTNVLEHGGSGTLPHLIGVRPEQQKMKGPMCEDVVDQRV